MLETIIAVIVLAICAFGSCAIIVAMAAKDRGFDDGTGQLEAERERKFHKQQERQEARVLQLELKKLGPADKKVVMDVIALLKKYPPDPID